MFNRLMYLNMFRKSIAMTLALVLCSQLTFAQEAIDVSLTSAQEALPLYQTAEIVSTKQKRLRHSVVALGPYEKRQNRWVSENFLTFSGVLSRQTHEIPKDDNEQDVYDFYKAFYEKDSELLFECLSHNCGSSNNWANVHFQIKQLYGLDAYQYYRVQQLATGEYVTLYIVRRGNRRIYAQIDILKPE